MLEVHTTIVAGSTAVVSAVPLSSVSSLGPFYTHLGFRFPIDSILLWYLGLVEGIAGVQGLAVKKTNDKVFSGKPL
jgi:hypothetical protein